MEQHKAIELLAKNLNTVEKKFESFFTSSEPRWPGETRDYLRNHHKNLQNLSMKHLTFDDLGINGLPSQIVSELVLAFEDFRKGDIYS